MTEKKKKEKSKQPVLPGMPKPGKVSVAIEEFLELKDDQKSLVERMKLKKLEIIREMKQDNVRHLYHQGYTFTVNSSETLTIKKEGKKKKAGA